MADLAKSKLRRKIPDLVEALTGHFDDHHALLVAELLASIDGAEATLARLDAALETEMAPWAEQLALLQTIPGIGIRAAHTIIAETGGDMSRFPTAGAWPPGPDCVRGCTSRPGTAAPGGAGTATSGCARRWSRPPHSVARSKGTYLASEYARIAGRRGAGRAAVAVAHSLLVIAYHVLDRAQPYQELGPDYLTRRHTDEAHTRRLVRQLEHLGHKVILDPADPAA